MLNVSLKTLIMRSMNALSLADVADAVAVVVGVVAVRGVLDVLVSAELADARLLSLGQAVALGGDGPGRIGVRVRTDGSNYPFNDIPANTASDDLFAFCYAGRAGNNGDTARSMTGSRDFSCFKNVAADGSTVLSQSSDAV